MHTTRFSGHLGVSAQEGVHPPDPEADTPPPTDQEADTSHCKLGYTPPPLHAGIQPPPHLWTEWLTGRCKKHYLPATSFAGSSNDGNSGHGQKTLDVNRP